MKEMKNSCDRCGTCCQQGGPALHLQDRHLVESGFFDFEVLVTIRKGEPAYHPLADKPEPVQHELIKIQGQGADWCCRFFSTDSSCCTIYEDRPLTCRLLKCWEPSEVVAVAGRDLLDRFDLIPDTDPLLPLVRLHEQECPCPDLKDSAARLRFSSQRNELLDELGRLVNRDLALRALAAGQFSLSVGRELFYFGRPLFQLLAPLGITVAETPQGLVLSYSGESRLPGNGL